MDNLDERFKSFVIVRRNSETENFFKHAKNLYSAEFISGFSLTAAAKMIKIIKDNKIDIIHAHTGTAANYALALKPFVKCTIATRRVTVPIKNPVKKWKYKKLDRVVIVSKNMTEQLRFLKDIEWIESAIDPKFSECITRNEAIHFLNIDDKFMYICSVGKIETMKGQDYLIKAFALLKKEMHNVKLIIAGSGNTKKLIDTAKALNVQKDIIFTGFVEDTRYIYAASDVCVVSSIFGEGSSAVIKEALSCKIPVVSTNIGSADYLINDNGLLVEPKNIKQMKNAILELLMKKRAVNFDTERFLPKNMTKKYEKLYENCFLS